MRVILNQDVPNLGELGDVKDVAPGYARNFLFPRNFALAFNKKTQGLFEKRQAEIESLKAQKRQASSGLKEKLEAEEVVVAVPAGQNGKLYGAVTNASVYDELLKKGIDVDRKKIEVPGRSIKSVGNYKVVVHLYEKDEAIIRLVVQAAEVKAEERSADESPRPRRERRERRHVEEDDSPEAQMRAFLASQGLEPEDEPAQE
ncbi:MAG: 50S ribosomal protein L9 [Spirochaetaceae bacterium]|nr:50S ribosomal protein L9 [Spirochaetaceae bacterium]